MRCCYCIATICGLQQGLDFRMAEFEYKSLISKSEPVSGKMDLYYKSGLHYTNYVGKAKRNAN